MRAPRRRLLIARTSNDKSLSSSPSSPTSTTTIANTNTSSVAYHNDHVRYCCCSCCCSKLTSFRFSVVSLLGLVSLLIVSRTLAWNAPHTPHSMTWFSFLSKRSHPRYSSSSSSTTTATAITTTTRFATTTSSDTSNNNHNNHSIDMNTNTPNPLVDKTILERRLRAALWCFFAGDALASPTHWYYGGSRQVQGDYGRAGITDYTKPVHHLPGSILNKSNLNGGGRAGGGTGGSSSSSSPPPKTIVGDVILHGKRDLWHPKEQVHYHATLQAGETTLEATLALRVLMKSLSSTRGVLDPDHFRRSYVTFMQTPGSHNDTYASTCHRMFFANLVFRGLEPEDCPDNDQHNVDTIDGLVLPTIAALAAAARSGNDPDIVGRAAAACAAVTRRSAVLERTAASWGNFLGRALFRGGRDGDGNDNDGDSLESNLVRYAREAGLPRPRSGNQMTACYLPSALPALVDNLVLYQNQPVWHALLGNANTGGENVHRGSCLGAALGLYAADDPNGIPEQLQTGLYHYQEIKTEIDAFVAAVLSDD